MSIFGDLLSFIEMKTQGQSKDEITQKRLKHEKDAKSWQWFLLRGIGELPCVPDPT